MFNDINFNMSDSIFNLYIEPLSSHSSSIFKCIKRVHTILSLFFFTTIRHEMSEETTHTKKTHPAAQDAKNCISQVLLLFLKTIETLFLFLFFSCTQTITVLSFESYF